MGFVTRTHDEIRLWKTTARGHGTPHSPDQTAISRHIDALDFTRHTPCHRFGKSERLILVAGLAVANQPDRKRAGHFAGIFTRDDGSLQCPREALKVPTMAFRIVSCWLSVSMALSAQTPEPMGEQVRKNGRPAIIATSDLDGFTDLPEDRKRLIDAAIAVVRDSPWLPYTARGSSPADGGFDCSGAMYYVMRKVDLDPPRTSAAQFQWLKSKARLREMKADATDLLPLPGDLLFWGRKATTETGGESQITHIAMYLGKEKKDGRQVMINSTDGRSYRGVKANGYGVYDFRLPKPDAAISFMGYGTPPGIAEGIGKKPATE
jgi:peptidoglycan DL-endopeptidase CwlO